MERDVVKTDEEWRAELSPERYQVLRRAGTEPPGSGEYVHTKTDGTYRCAACDAVLFRSDDKFDSGTGWPSFTQPAVADALELVEDRSGHGAHRGQVPAVRLTPRACVPRRAAPDGAAVLHELAGAGVARRRRERRRPRGVERLTPARWPRDISGVS